MKNLFCLAGFLFFAGHSLCAQSFTSSNLPIVIITTDGNAQIPDEPKILASMKIVYAGEGIRNNVSDQNNTALLNYNGRIKIEIRGSSSQSLPKNQYGLTTVLADNSSNNNVSLLGMPKENDWILNGLAFDASLIRDYLSYNLSRKMGNYAPRTKYCEVIINGDYRGLYLLQEKVKANDNRVDIRKIDPADNALPDLSGGYITKADKVAGTDVPAWSVSSYIGFNDVTFIHEFPKPTAITPEQNYYIQTRFEELSQKANDPSVVNGFPSVIDVPSFLDFMISNELAANVDAYQFSTYFHKDKNGKLRAGPLWDLNLTYGNDLTMWGLDRSKTDKWQFNNGDNIGARFWKDLFDNTTFKCYLSKRLNELTQIGAPLNLTSIETFIDETVLMLSEATVREQTRWNTVGNQTTNINYIKSFLAIRMDWMKTNLGSFSGCDNVQTPPLVISRIMYQPAVSTEFPESDVQEFIEIVNNGNVDVDMTGIYFGGTGFVFQFPDNAILPAHGTIQLANKVETFQQLYQYTPFGEFTRSLSNDGEKLMLLDGYGNIIDLVEYSSQAPWPNAADNGKLLKLSNLNLDNNVAANWVAANPVISTTVVGIEDPNASAIQLYPNPVDDELRITSTKPITALFFRDLEGRVLETFQTSANSAVVNLVNYSHGMYFLTVITNGKAYMRKVMKK